MFTKRNPFFIAAIVFLTSMLATFGLWKNGQQEAKRALQTDFDFQVRQTARRIETRMATYEQATRAVQAFLLGSLDVKRDDIRLFVESLHLQEKFPGIQGLAIVQVVPASMLQQHTNAVQQQGFPGYNVHPKGDRALYSSIIQIEPFTGLNLRALGFDMLTSPVRRLAMERARDTGQAAASGKVKLIQENGAQEQPGLVMYLPVYKRGMPATTTEERRANHIGWVGAPFRMNDLMAGLGGERTADIMLSIYDGEAISADSLLFDSEIVANRVKPATSLFEAKRRILIAGHPWTLDIRSSPRYEDRLETGKPLLIAISGTGASVMLALLVWALASGRQRALTLANAMTRQLRESEFRWKFALEGAGDGVWDWNVQTNEVIYSERWKAMLGYREAEIQNDQTQWERLIHPEDRQRTKELLEAYLKNWQSDYSNEYRMLCKDGTWRWILARGAVVSRDALGNAQRLIGTHTDITHRKQQEEALREANARLEVEQHRVRVILENLHDGFVAVDPDGRITDWNAQAQKILGWTPTEAIGKDLTSLIIPAELRSALAEGFKRFVATGQATLIDKVVEVNVLHRSGRLIPIELAVAGFPVAGKYAVSAFMRDISERKEAERMEAERTHALNEAREALQHAQKLEAVGKLTGGVAHDFNNVLQVISGNVQIMEHFYGHDPQAKGRLDGMMSAVDRGSKLSAQLLAFARRQPLRPTVVNPLRIVRNMDDLLQRALGDNIAFGVIAPDDLWNTFVDSSQLENVILNLALNARDAMPDGGKLAVELSNVTSGNEIAGIRSDLATGDYVLLAVSDTGVGMTEEVMAQAFEPFFTTKPAGEGTGLGLSMAYGFVKQSNGHIHLGSKPGNGTTIKIYLPRSMQPEMQTLPPVPEPTFGGDETILVVEDDPAVQATVIGMLEGLGYRVLKADNGDDALEIIERGEKIDLLFTDVVMPGAVSSPELARQAKQILPGLGVLFTSGYTRNALVSGGRLEDGVHLLSKPYRREQLARKIRQVLAQQLNQNA
ncbi:CHASE domain-containing protein [Noviherbaspirillum galbum]|uniref:histidine kinase n=1 Tax=Noviherbaspirillum galbum TaxID=2709383 RepID=A0A6B3SQB5_9BURK|nr:CHASE domain-containing protein [Noviherbaspirillum galbum]NEX60602.1 PAS domain S-box protein [Noviherbaspirillum galbum]